MKTQNTNTGSALPEVLANWVNNPWNPWVRNLLQGAQISEADLVFVDPNKSITPTGNSLLGMAAQKAEMAVMKYFLEECNANPNSTDHYGRTPLVHFLREVYSWKDEPEFGVSGIEMLIKHGADANTMFTPDWVGQAGCKKWRIVHHCRYASTLSMVHDMPEQAIATLSKYWDENLPDGNGRVLADYEQLPRITNRRNRERESKLILDQLSIGNVAFANMWDGVAYVQVQVLSGFKRNSSQAFRVKGTFGEKSVWGDQLRPISNKVEI